MQSSCVSKGKRELVKWTVSQSLPHSIVSSLYWNVKLSKAGSKKVLICCLWEFRGPLLQGWGNRGKSGTKSEYTEQQEKTEPTVLLLFSCPLVSSFLWPLGQASLSLIIFRSWPKFMSIASVMPSSHFILWCPLLLPSIFPSIRETFPMSQLFASGDQITGAWASASVLPMNIQGWFPLRLTGLISLLSKGLSGVFSSTIVRKHQFLRLSAFSTVQLSHPHVTTWKTIALTVRTFVGRVMSLLFNTLSRFVHKSSCEQNQLKGAKNCTRSWRKSMCDTNDTQDSNAWNSNQKTDWILRGKYHAMATALTSLKAALGKQGFCTCYRFHYSISGLLPRLLLSPQINWSLNKQRNQSDLDTKVFLLFISHSFPKPSCS